ncbi:MAG: PorP/SprF family type IX secretion system membrane protein [Bacteroidia bacterium]|nr:PorP/SprF family type IX secretion system membrane protein [Bacteroidia bacterium]
MLAQDPHYTQFYANQQLLSPAFAGAGSGPRVALNYRAQWVAIPGSYRQMGAGYDQPLYFGRSVQGFGFQLHNDKAGEGNLSKLDLTANYSFAIQMGDARNPHYLRLGLGAGVQQSSIDMTKLRFGDQIDTEEGFIYATNEKLSSITRFTPDVNFGMAWYNKFAWVSASVHHITEPSQVFKITPNVPGSINTKWPRKYTLTGGIAIPAGPMNNPDAVTISPAFLFMSQRNFNQLALGTYVHIKPIVFGAWYRANFNNYLNQAFASDMIAGLVGFKEGIFSVGYSYDYTISRLSNRISGGSHEIALIIEFDSDPKSHFRHHSLPCPRF